MGLFKKIKNVVKAVAAPVTQTVKAVASVAQGDLSGAVKNATGAVTASNPLQMANAATGGAVASGANYIPIIGSPLNKSLTAGEKISSGEFSNRDLKNYATEQAKLGALVYGGVLAAPTLGIGGTITAGSALSQGNIAGVVSAVGGGYGIDSNLTDFAGNLAGGLINKQQGYTPAKLAPTVTQLPTGKTKTLTNTEKAVLAGAAAIGAVFLARKFK